MNSERVKGKGKGDKRQETRRKEKSEERFGDIWRELTYRVKNAIIVGGRKEKDNIVTRMGTPVNCHHNFILEALREPERERERKESQNMPSK